MEQLRKIIGNGYPMLLHRINHETPLKLISIRTYGGQ
jgi:hypothetical protein